LNIKNQSSQNLGEMIEISTNRKWKKNEKIKHLYDVKFGWYKYTTRFQIGNKIFDANLIIRNDADGKKYLYDVINIKGTVIQRGENSPYQQNINKDSSDISETNGSYDNTISQNNNDVNSIISKNSENDTEFSLDSKINAYYDNKTKTIYLNENANKPYLTLLGHELYHSLALADKSKLASFFRQNVDTNSSEFKAYKENKFRVYTAKYKETGRTFTERDFWHEFTAENCETLFTNKDFIEKLSRKDRTLVQKILDFIRDMWTRLTLNQNYTYSKATKVANMTAETLAQAEAMYAKALGVKSWAFALQNAIYENTENDVAVAEMGYGETNAVYAMKNDSRNNPYWHIETEKDIFKHIANTKELQRAAFDFILHGEKGENVNEIIDGKYLKFIRLSGDEYLRGTQSRTLNRKNYNQKMRIVPSVIDLIANASTDYHSNTKHNNAKLFIDGFTNYRGRVRIDDVIFNYIVRVGKTVKDNIFYDINLEVDVEVPSVKKHVSSAKVNRY
jgi:hypothetical protein